MRRRLEWKDEYRIGNESIDGEHEKLFALANEVFRINNPLMSAGRIREIVKELYEYMRQHFKNEEEHMEKISYSGIKIQKEGHEAIINEMNGVLKSSSNFIQLENMLVEVMEEWLLTHILREDMKIGKPVEVPEEAKKEAGSTT